MYAIRSYYVRFVNGFIFADSFSVAETSTNMHPVGWLNQKTANYIFVFILVLHQ